MSEFESSCRYLRNEQGLSLRYGHWPLSGGDSKGTVLVLQGRSEYLEKYEETVAGLHDRGLDVISFDWRGQGLSDRMLPERQKGFVGSYEDYLKDLDLVLKSVVRPAMRGKLYWLSHSMGGHIALRCLLDRDRFEENLPLAGAVFCAPMLDIVTRPFPSLFARWLSRLQVAAGNAHGAVVGDARRTPFPVGYEGNIWTSDRERFERNRNRIMARPELSAAVVTYGWVAATYGSIGALKAAVKKRRVKVPTLFVIAENDRVVSRRAVCDVVAAQENARLVEIPGARHEILQEADTQRECFWRAFDAFVGL